MFSLIRRKFRYLCSRVWWLKRKFLRKKIVIKRFGRLNFRCDSCLKRLGKNREAVRINGQSFLSDQLKKPIRIATFNVAMFSLAPSVPEFVHTSSYGRKESFHLNKNFFKVDSPRSILKSSTLHSSISGLQQDPCGSKSLTKPSLKFSINLHDNERSLAQQKLLASMEEHDEDTSTMISNAVHSGNCILARSPVCFPFGMNVMSLSHNESLASSRSIFEVLREVDADLLALQDVKAEEQKNMKPLSELAGALGMDYVFAESWAPEYGNAILSKWPIRRWHVQKIADDDDFRNILKATIDVPWVGEINLHCTQLDHLDETWRMKQVYAITNSNDAPHVLAGGLNSLHGPDYSSDRWTDIVKYHEKLGKPNPKTEVMNFLKGKGYTDAKDYAGECDPVVTISKGQNVQGTCKYGTRVDYILGSQNSACKFVPGSYSVISSKGTSDHHIVKVDVVRTTARAPRSSVGQCKIKRKIARLTN